MTLRSEDRHGPSKEGRGTGGIAEPGPPRRQVPVAIGIAGVGAVLTGLAPLVGVVSPATPPGYPSWPLLLVTGALPCAVAVVLLRRGRPTAAAAALLGAATITPGRLVMDLQLLVDPAQVVRPALLLPRDLDPLAPSAGVWLVLAAHVAAGVAGVVAVTGRSASGGETRPAVATRGNDREVASPRRQDLLAAAMFAAALGVAGVMLAQFGTTDPYLMPGAALDSPALVLSGSVLVALAISVAAGTAVGSTDPDAARGGLLGLAAALAGLSLTSLVGAWLTVRLQPGWGAGVGLLAAVAVTWLAVPAGRSGEPRPASELRLPGLGRLFALTGALALTAGVLSVAGAVAPQLHMPPGIREFTPYAARTLVPAGLAMLALGAALFVPAWAARARPALAVAWTAVPLAGAATLDTVLTAAQAADAGIGIGAWAAILAVVVAGLAGLVATVAGGVERDDVDLTEVPLTRTAVAPAAVAGLLALGAYSLPVVTAPDFEAPGVFTGFDTTSWGLVTALLAVLAAVALAPLCRSSRAVMLLGGAALVVGVRVLELPLTAARTAGSGPGPGLWSGLACLVALGATAVMASRTTR